jgi:large subunit ribosomal protein L21
VVKSDLSPLKTGFKAIGPQARLPVLAGPICFTGGMFMYAIIETGGKQYRVEEGKAIRVEKLPQTKGETVLFDRVLMVNSGEDLRLGNPYLAGGLVRGKVITQGRDRKIIVFKFKAKKNYKRTQGHRQPFSEVLIQTIETAGN